VSDQKDKLVFDEQTLARVLEAAYVLQEHNRAVELNLELQSSQLREQHAQTVQMPALAEMGSDDKSSAKDDYTPILAEIVETQHQIQVRQLDLESTMALVTDRLTHIARATGAAIGIVEGKTICYRAGSGTSALPSGTKLPMEKGLCFTSLHTGQVMRCADVHPDFLLDAEECGRRGIQSLIAVPVYHEAGVAGALELHFAQTNTFNEQDVHTCQLMAGLITEALTRDSQLAWKKSVTAERASMLQAIERLQPSLAALTQDPVAKESEPNQVAPDPTSASTFACWKCGHTLAGEEQFCGKCGAPRTDHEPSSLQSKVATLWQMTESRIAPELSENITTGSAETAQECQAFENVWSEPGPQKSDLNDEDLERELARFLANTAPDFSVKHDPSEIEQPATRSHGVYNEVSVNHAEDEHVEDTANLTSAEVRSALEDGDASSEEALQETGQDIPEQDITWTSAANARVFLEHAAQSGSNSGLRRYWNERRGVIYLVVAILVMVMAISRGVWSGHRAGATGSGIVTSTSHLKPNADLSMLDKLLIGAGLAEPPDRPEPKGNPNTQVWVDTHTALYYCPGADLYGKTPKGKFTSQKDAQLDQFEPAYRKACD
jgi:GAF domain-containing protein